MGAATGLSSLALLQAFSGAQVTGGCPTLDLPCCVCIDSPCASHHEWVCSIAGLSSLCAHPWLSRGLEDVVLAHLWPPTSAHTKPL